jgi:hypothetical protein
MYKANLAEVPQTGHDGFLSHSSSVIVSIIRLFSDDNEQVWGIGESDGAVARL